MTLLSLQQLSEQLNIALNSTYRAIQQGKIPGAIKVNLPGQKPVWRVPEKTVATTEVIRAPVGKVLSIHWPNGIVRTFKMPKVFLPICDKCQIILERSGSGDAPNDSPDAVCCWMCRETYGEP